MTYLRWVVMFMCARLHIGVLQKLWLGPDWETERCRDTLNIAVVFITRLLFVLCGACDEDEPGTINDLLSTCSDCRLVKAGQFTEAVVLHLYMILPMVSISTLHLLHPYASSLVTRDLPHLPP
jgi:hypothetical protein